VVTSTKKIGPASYLVKNFVELCMKLASQFGIINDTAPWIDPANPDMRFHGSELKNQRAFFVITDDAAFGDTCPLWVAKFSYPGFQYGAMLLYRDARFVPIVDKLFAALNTHLRISGLDFTMNHCIATRYVTRRTIFASILTRRVILRPIRPCVACPHSSRGTAHFSLVFHDIATMCSRAQILTKTSANRRARAKRAAEKLAVAPTVGKKTMTTPKKRLPQKIVSKK
jgi:hypothetical protein